MNRKYILTHRNIDILYDEESENYFLHTEPFPYETLNEAIEWINLVTPALIEKEGKFIEIEAGITTQLLLGYQKN